MAESQEVLPEYIEAASQSRGSTDKN
jgi:hypothetical protein